MEILEDLAGRIADPARPFLLAPGGGLSFQDVLQARNACASNVFERIQPGDCVALIGDFNAASISALLCLVERNAVIVPLTAETAAQHQEFMTSAYVNAVIDATSAAVADVPDGTAKELSPKLLWREEQKQHPLLALLREQQRPGVVFFSSGSTGTPKAILHDFSKFLARFKTPRPALRTLNFLLFDHIGGLNTLFHTLYNNGTVIALRERSVEAVLDAIERFSVELLPTTPTFLRMLLLSGEAERLARLRIISYGTERMDEGTLRALADLLPGVDFRQTYGMSEIGILRVTSRARNSLFIKVGGEGVETCVRDGVLFIRSANRMLGYLNAPSPFDAEGWYNTRDLVEVSATGTGSASQAELPDLSEQTNPADFPPQTSQVAQVDSSGGWLKIIGRDSDIITVGGLKVTPAEVERAALSLPGVLFAKAVGKANPLTGMHVELHCELAAQNPPSPAQIKAQLRALLPPHAVPMKIHSSGVVISHRLKRL